ncbi:MAG: hypothetical protein R2708_12455 [Vicinamibacterales bacterium]
MAAAIEQFHRVEPAQGLAFEGTAIKRPMRGGHLGGEPAHDGGAELVFQRFCHPHCRIHGLE